MPGCQPNRRMESSTVVRHCSKGLHAEHGRELMHCESFLLNGLGGSLSAEGRPLSPMHCFGFSLGTWYSPSCHRRRLSQYVLRE
jgi:hypothetical protein